MGGRTQQWSQLIHDGREVADLIVESHREFESFLSFYDKWVVHRTASMSLLEKLLDIINDNSKKYSKLKELISQINTVSELVGNNIPFPAVSIGTRIAAAIASFISKLLSTEYSKEDLENKEFEIKKIFQKDIDTSSLVYLHGVKCGTQFEKTCCEIKDFHKKIQENYNTIIEDEDVFEFMSEISEYNPSNISVFYRRLRMGYEKLIANFRSNDSRTFIRVFEDVPEAVRVINLLAWRFDSDGFDISIVHQVWENLFAVLHDQEASVKEFLVQIQNCLSFLGKEKDLLERTVSNLLREKM